MKRAVLHVAFLALVAFAAATDKKILDFADLTRWNTIRQPALSKDGKWLAYAQAPIEGDGVLYVKRTDGSLERKVDRGSSLRFMKDGRFAVVTIVPAKKEADDAKKAKKPAPKSRYAWLSLESGTVTSIDGAGSVRMSEDDPSWVAVQFEPPKDKKTFALEFRKPGQTSIVHLDGVSDYAIAKNGSGAAVAFAEKEGLVWVDAATGRKTTIENQKGTYSGMAIAEKTGEVAFVFEPAAEKDKPKPLPIVKRWVKGGKVEQLPTAGPAKGYGALAKAALRFSKDGTKLYLNVGNPPPPEVKPGEAPDEAAVLDVWRWNDPQIQPQQILNLASELNRGYLAVWHLRTNKVAQLESPELKNVTTPANGDSNFALGFDSRAYEVQSTWTSGGSDVYVVDVGTGAARRIATQVDRPVTASPTGRYAVWYDDASRGYMVCVLGEPRPPKMVTSGVPTPLWSDLSDTPGEPAPYGIAGWTKGDAELLIYDKFDLWAVDPTGKVKPRCVTDGFGRRWEQVLRLVDLDPEEEAIDPSKPLLLSSADEKTRANGFYSCPVAGGAPEKLRVEDKSFGTPVKAKDADVLLVTRQSFEEFPDLYVTDRTFKDLKRMSDANPQQAEYLWGSVELVEWTSADGVKYQGVLTKPAGFDPAKKYPMIVTFYERSAWTYNRYSVPAPMGGAGANASFYAGRGYLVFQPDIGYQVGYPGKSAVAAVVPGCLSLVQRGFVDPDRMAIVGHSWGGYEVDYLVTQTNLFRCAVAGAAVSNMTSAYGGIRWGSGVLRQFQYEVGQSRIGGSLWENPLQYIENSPIFWVDRIKTPILLLHNDKDGAVPWEQSIEFYAALRRLRKPVWLINYNGEDHGIGKMPNRKDWTIRMTQFFDHYLKDAPMPVWMADGLPATQKGRSFGLEPKSTAKEQGSR